MNLYSVSLSLQGKREIVIQRKSSNIPEKIDRGLTHLAASVYMDGPNSKVVYEFSNANSLSKAEEFLKNMNWERDV